MIRPAVLSLLAVLVLSLAACGGGGGKKLSKADLSKRADGICRDFAEKINKLPKPDQAGDFKGLNTYFNQARDLADDQQSALEKLKPADDVKDDWDSFVAKDKKGVTLLGKLGKATQKKDAKTATSLLTKITKAVADTDAAGQKVGVTSCGSGPSS